MDQDNIHEVHIFEEQDDASRNLKIISVGECSQTIAGNPSMTKRIRRMNQSK
jgi:hypothetical protein